MQVCFLSLSPIWANIGDSNPISSHFLQKWVKQDKIFWGYVWLCSWQGDKIKTRLHCVFSCKLSFLKVYVIHPPHFLGLQIFKERICTSVISLFLFRNNVHHFYVPSFMESLHSAKIKVERKKFSIWWSSEILSVVYHVPSDFFSCCWLGEVGTLNLRDVVSY